MASSSSSSLKNKRNYDVFLSFRGTNVRNNFLSHLYAALNQNGIFTYIDGEKLRKGEQISPVLMNAIEESRFAIIIFSKDYASSPWCLEEVAKIMECKERKGLIVLPVFYKVAPREVRGGRESYGRAMVEHESKFGKDSEIVKRCKKALLDAGSLSGWDLNDGDEAILIKKIVEEISMQLDRRPLHVAKHPVGIHHQVEKLESMLNLESDDVLMIGLWGQGGIGKTTLAKALYNAIFRQFEGSCFLVNVREASKDSKDLVPMQEKLLTEILLGKTAVVYSVDGGINLMKDRLCRKKVLLVLDDVNDVKQLNALAGDCEWFGKGSRIIITTRDSHLLTSHGIDGDHIYEAKGLEHFEAFELFNKHAFPRNNKAVIRRDLLNSALHYANGLPLALEVLGSFLCSRREREWESAFNKLAKSPEKTINDVLKLSYDGLEDYAKDVFLDICCFFKGRSTKYIIKVLDSCDFDTTIGVQVLVEKSLIIEEEGALQMHDLIQLMGMDIVKQECRDDPGRRSRLWLCDDVRDVLSGNMGTNAVKAIVLNLHKPEEIYIGHDAFTNMRRLRMLIMINVHNSFQGPICLPNELRWFEWPECAPWIPEFSSGPKKLVGLDMHKSNIRVLREQFKDFENLKFINISECQSVVYMPDLYCTPNLEELDLHGCKNLKRAHDSIAYHDKLQFLNLSGCSNLHHFPDVLQSKNLEHLNLNHCSKLQTFPNIPEKIKGLQRLQLRGTSIEELPASIENLVSLEDMILSECKKLAILPSSIYRLRNLENLSVDGCSKLIKFPKNKEDSSDPQTKTGFPKLKILDLSRCNLSEVEFLENRSCFPTLTTMMLSGNNFTNLPTCEQLHNLLSLQVSCCRQLQEIINIPGKLWYLEARSCESLTRIPSNICDVNDINLSFCHELVSNGFTMNDLFKLEQFVPRTRREILLRGGEMPEWVLPNKDGYISFMASKDLYKKILGLAYCVVFKEKGHYYLEFWQEAYINGKKTRKALSKPFHGLDSDHVWLEYRQLNLLWGGDPFGPNEWRQFQFKIRAYGGGIVKKCGFRLICKPLEYDLEVFLQHNQLLDPALLYEVWHDDSQMSTKEESSNEGEDLLQMSIEEESSSESEDLLQMSSSETEDLLQMSTEGESSSETEDLLQLSTSETEDLLQMSTEGESSSETEDLLQMSTEEESSSETEDLLQMSAEDILDGQTSTEEDIASKLVYKGLNKADFSIEKFRYSHIPRSYRDILPGGEIPEGFVLVEDDTISFLASEELYTHILRFALCVVFGVDDGIKKISFDIVPHVNGQRRNMLSGALGSFNSDHIWIQIFEPPTLWAILEGGVDFDEFNERYIQFGVTLRISGGTVKKLGYKLRHRELEDDLKAELEENQLVDPASLCEDFPFMKQEVSTTFT